MAIARTTFEIENERRTKNHGALVDFAALESLRKWSLRLSHTFLNEKASFATHECAPLSEK